MRRRTAGAIILALVCAVAVWGVVALGDDDGGGVRSAGTLAGSDTTTSTAAAGSTSATTTTVVRGGTATTVGVGATTTAPPGTSPATVATTVPAARRVAEGTWGGRGIRLVVGPSGATVEYDCASGVIGQALALDAGGSFRADGSHTFQRGGPVQSGTPPPAAQPARYTGSVRGTQMELTVVLPQTGTTLGPFSLGLGQQPLLDRCG